MRYNFAEAYELRYKVHPCLMNMYHDLKEIYWWNNMKQDVANFMAKGIVCQQVNVEHLRPGGLPQEIELPVWK